MADYSGTSGDDSYWGGSEADRIEGQGGRDHLNGNGGDDQIFGGDDDDGLNGGLDNDLLEGGAGNDTLSGNEGMDTLRGQGGDDRLLLLSNDYLGISGDSIDGGDGVDTLQFDGFALTGPITFSIADPAIAQNIAGATIVNVERLSFRSGTGNDDITGGANDDSIDGFDGNDRVDGGLGNDVLFGGGGIDTVYGGGGDDTIYGGQDSIYGGDGDDVIRSSGDTLVDGGAGTDQLRMEIFWSIGVTVDVSNPNVETLVLGTRVTGIERLWFYSGSGNDRLTGGTGDDELMGNGGDDILVGGTGNDRLSGGDGFDQLSGGNGDDFLHNVTGDPNPTDLIDGGDGFDSLEYRVTSAVGPITIDLLATTGTVVNVEQISFSAWSGSGVNTVSGGALNDTMLGGGGPNIFNGRGGDDDLRGGASGDSIFGGDGDDFIDGEGGADWLEGGDGDDFVRARGTGVSRLDGGAGNDSLYSGAGGDTLIGGGGDDVLDGGAGNDQLQISGTGTSIAGGGGDTDTLVVAWGDAVTAITMSAPVSDPAGGYAGTIGDGGDRSLAYSSIEVFNITTGSGNDIIRGGGITTTIPGNFINQYSLGAGDDLFYSMGGTDTVDAGAGVDGFSGTLGANGGAILWSLQPTALPGLHNIYTGFEYFLSLTTGSGQDTIVTANANRADAITLGAGSDTATLYDGFDIVIGGESGAGNVDSGFDTLIVNYGAATSSVFNQGSITGNSAGFTGRFTDGVTRSVNFEAIDRFLIATGSGADNIVTGDGNDEIRTGGGNDIANAGAGNDFIDGGSGDDSMTGGTGNDIYVVSSAADLVIENAGEGIDEVRTTLATYVLAANVENLTATSDSSHDFRGNSGDNFVTGRAGNDFVRLQDGGNDTAFGGEGNDVFLFGATMNRYDVVDGGGGLDQIALQGGGAVIFAGVVGVESIGLLAGNDTRFGDTAGNFYSYDLTTRDINVAAGLVLTVDGAKLRAGENFLFDGSDETDGSFFIYGGRGIDILTGGAKNDTFLFGSDGHFGASDVVNGGAGIDQLALRGSYSLTFGAGQLIGIESIGLLSAQDTRYGALGTSYSYNLTMNDGNVAGGVQMTVDGAKLRGTETLAFNGSAESDGSFRVFGGANGDIIAGSQNGDVLQGNGGADQLTGGGGADTFRYAKATDSVAGSADHILDFASGTDKIDLSKLDANSNAAGDQAFTWIGSAAFSGVEGQLRAYQSGSDWFVEGDMNGDSVADLVIQVSVTGGPLVQGDFLP
ncbi:MAG TPA: calcium-binding protein [Allosphingosinicella sp.]|jgi:Ca2+-binding RTX toxin-like protein